MKKALEIKNQQQEDAQRELQTLTQINKET
jgi:hypothetical protein